MVKIIVDSTSDIPQEEAARLGITVVPLTVRFGTEEYRDGVDLMPAEFFKKFAASKELPTTSQVSSGVFMDVFREQLAGKDDEIVALLRPDLPPDKLRFAQKIPRSDRPPVR